ncbi:MAG: discoidin domain-containing protein [Verrucomicrobia bacterium]|nr:discoidin domain-containing protein [Verrucomicrobiota bacterium]
MAMIRNATARAVLLVAGGCLSCDAAQEPPPLRQVINFNRDFRFSLGVTKDGEQPSLDDSGWEPIGLPHSFSIPYFRASGFYVGEGWYRKHFTVPEGWTGKRIRLEFEGAFQHTSVYLNGVPVGKHDGGYTGFDLDLTPLAKTGDNLLAVRVDNRWDPVLPPRAGEHVFCGGIYRDVRLVVADPLHIPRNGVLVTTPEVSKNRALVKVAVTLSNEGKSPRSCAVRARLFGPDGTTLVAQALTASRAMAAGQTTVMECAALMVEKPLLWHPDHPQLYSVRVAVEENGRAVDETVVRTGLRWFKFTADKGFFLNGESLRLRGANAHQDHAGWGDAVTNAGHWRDVKLIKEAGMNFIRGSHYPHDPAFLTACDELGMLFWSESCFWGMGGFGGEGYWNSSAYPPNQEHWQPFEENAKRGLKEMILDARNHPSVIIWSMSNEPFFTVETARALALASAMIQLSHELDPTRPATVGGAQRGGFDQLGDVASYNGDGAKFPNPGIPSVVSEYGSHVDNRPGIYDPCWGDAMEQPAWRSGEALWCAFHHGSIAGEMGRMGMIDHFRLPLRTWYWYRNAYRGIAPPEWPTAGTPAKLKLEADRTTFSNDGTEDCQLIVSVLDADGRQLINSPPVTLEVVSGPGEFPTGPSITFRNNTDLDIREGQAAIEFRSYYGGTTVIRASSPGLTDATLGLTTTGLPTWNTAKDQTRHARPYPGPLTDPRAAAPSVASAANLALNRPTSSSSQEEKNPARCGNDGGVNTRWCATGNELPAWWRVDLENFYFVSNVTITFEKAVNYRFRVEVSEDGEQWRVASDQSARTSADRVCSIPLATKPRARFLRVVYTGLPDGVWPSHCEVEVAGAAEDRDD